MEDLKYELQLIKINIEYIRNILDIIIKYQFIAENMREEIKTRYDEIEQKYKQLIKEWVYTIE